MPLKCFLKKNYYLSISSRRSLYRAMRLCVIKMEIFGISSDGTAVYSATNSFLTRESFC